MNRAISITSRLALFAVVTCAQIACTDSNMQNGGAGYHDSDLDSNTQSNFLPAGIDRLARAINVDTLDVKIDLTINGVTDSVAAAPVASKDGNWAAEFKVPIDTEFTVEITWSAVGVDGARCDYAKFRSDYDAVGTAASFSVSPTDYDMSVESFDDDGDGSSNFDELVAGTPVKEGLGLPQSAVVATLDITAIKIFSFNWEEVAGATFYRLLENPDGASGFSVVGPDIPVGVRNYRHRVPLYARVVAQYIVEACNTAGCTESPMMTVAPDQLIDAVGYFKASNTDEDDRFGGAVALSADGTTLAIGAWLEDGGSAGVGGAEGDNSTEDAGAVYVFTSVNGNWMQQAYLKASNPDASDFFGHSLAITDDGNLLAVGARREDGGSTNINGDQSSNAETNAGAVYLFARNNGTWSIQTYLKSSNAQEGDEFGYSVSFNSDGSRLAVGAIGESSASTFTNPDQLDNSATSSGAVYVFSRSGNTWIQEAYVKATNTDARDLFGVAVSLDGSGNMLAIGAPQESSAGFTVNGNENDNSATLAGAAYVYEREAGRWRSSAYIKARNGGVHNRFGESLSLSGDGLTLAVGDSDDSAAVNSGAVYVYVKTLESWSEQAFLKSSNAQTADFFGRRTSLSKDGNRLAVGAPGENSSLPGITSANAFNNAGAVYVFDRAGSTWTEIAYLRDAGSDDGDSMGESGVSLSADGNTLAVSVAGEDSRATGISGDSSDDSARRAGAVYLY